MVCKNCGADLKPGVKYCLNCGSYIDEDDIVEEVEENESLIDITDDGEVSNEIGNDDINFDNIPTIEADEVVEKPKKKRKRKKIKLKLMDIIIYLGLLSIIVVSIVIIVLTITKKDNPSKTPPTPTVIEDSKVTMSDYTVTIPGKLRYTTESNRLYVSDNTNYTFSFNVTEDNYKKYSDDLTILSKQMEKSGYTVENSEKKINGTEEFIIYRIKVSSTVKYFYATIIDDRHTLMGIIEVLESGNWEESLPNITTVKKSIVYNNAENDVNKALEGNS